MALAVLEELPESREDWAVWSFCNMAHHRDIIRRVREIYEIDLVESVLDPFDLTNPATWLYKHQLMHQHMDAVLGIKGFDLVGVKWGDPDSMENWIAVHANEHFQAGSILNV